MSKHIKLYIPGPVEVGPDVLAVMSRPMIGHRSGDFRKLYQGLQPKLQNLFYTSDPVYLMTNSSFGAMEAGVRNCVRPGKKVLAVCNGAWGEKWAEATAACGHTVVRQTYAWGQAASSEDIRIRLSEGGYDAITIVHCETSTGIMNPIADIMAVVREFPEVISIVDTVSSFSALHIDKDALGIDVMLTGSQKALALPPGLALCSVSQRARDRAAVVPYRGFYLDFLSYHTSHLEGNTPNTPALSLIYALDYRCDTIAREGVQARYARHTTINKMVRDWAEANGFPTFGDRAHTAVTLVCGQNTRGVSLDAMNQRLKANHGLMINTGYGQLKDKTFRIATMGDETVESISTLIRALDSVLKSL